MASTKRSSGGTRKSTASRPRATSASKAASGTTSAKTRSNGRATGAKTPKAKTGATSARNGARKSQGTAGGRATASRNGSARSGGSPRNRPASSQTNGTAGTLKQKGAAVLQAAEKANGPALTVAAAVAGLAGGLALRQRPRLTDPGMAARSKSVLRDVDPSVVMEGIGKAAAQLSRRSKVLARELDQVADRAERFGKILS